MKLQRNPSIAKTTHAQTETETQALKLFFLVHFACLPYQDGNGVNQPKNWFLPTNQNLSQSQTIYSISTTPSASLHHPFHPLSPPILHRPHHYHHLPHHPLHRRVSNLLSSHRPNSLSFFISQEPLLFKKQGRCFYPLPTFPPRPRSLFISYVPRCHHLSRQSAEFRLRIGSPNPTL